MELSFDGLTICVVSTSL